MEAVALLLLLLHAAPLEPPDPRDVAFPHGYRPSDADRRLTVACHLSVRTSVERCDFW